nr:hypothetical protein [Clostridia bacterium]
MKKLIMALTIVVLVMSLSVPMFAAADGDSWGKVPITLDEIKVDAGMDPVYSYGLNTVITVPDKPEYKTGTTGEAWVLWDGKDTLFIYVEVMDKEVIMPHGVGEAWDTDSVEVFIDYSNLNLRTRDQYRIDVSGAPTYYATETINKDKVGEYGFEKWAAKKIDGGYAVEFEIRAYNEPIKSGMKIGFDLAINDQYMSGGNEIQATYHSPSKNTANGNPDKYNYFELSLDEVMAPEPEPAEEASVPSSATADPMLVIMAVSALTGGIVISKKRR